MKERRKPDNRTNRLERGGGSRRQFLIKSIYCYQNVPLRTIIQWSTKTTVTSST